MNPYYTVFFAPAIEDQLQAVAGIFRSAGYLHTDLERLHGRALGTAVAEAMLALSTDVGYPTTLRQVPGFSEAHIQRALQCGEKPAVSGEIAGHAGADVREDRGRVYDADFTGRMHRRFFADKEYAPVKLRQLYSKIASLYNE